jgi:hypothetical protein
MRDHYDFTDSKPNPYAAKLKKQVTIRLDEDTVEYFKQMSERKGTLPRYTSDSHVQSSNNLVSEK